MKVSNKHSKKRNAGLLYEFLVRLISQSLVDGDPQKSTLALNALKKYFRPGTELYKEFRLIHSLIKTEVSNVSVAASIIQEAKAAAKSHDYKTLEREKSFLIKTINHRLDDGSFWDQPIAEYKVYATVQTLINDWRNSGSAPLDRLASYEDQLTQWLVTKKDSPPQLAEQAGSVGENRLIFKLMMNKLNEKYGCVLSPEQKSVLREYVFNVSSGRDQSSLCRKLQEQRSIAVAKIDEHLLSENNKYVSDKLVDVKTDLLAENLDVVTDATITKFMLCMKLISELESKE